MVLVGKTEVNLKICKGMAFSPLQDYHTVVDNPLISMITSGARKVLGSEMGSPLFCANSRYLVI